MQSEKIFHKIKWKKFNFVGPYKMTFFIWKKYSYIFEYDVDRSTLYLNIYLLFTHLKKVILWSWNKFKMELQNWMFFV